MAFASGKAAFAAEPAQCTRTITADVVALDQPLMYNRLGAQNINGMIYALRNDVIDKSSGKPEVAGGILTAGNVALRPDKRPRPLVLRAAAGDCLTVNFSNLLAAQANPFQAPVTDALGQQFNVQIDDQVADRFAGFHPQGLELVGSIASDSSFTGENANSLVAPGQSASYTFFAPREGAFLVSSYGATFGGDATSGNTSNGLFGAVNVQPKRARFYRSQLTEEELRLATTGTTESGHPVIDYEATYPSVEPWIAEGKAGLPILNMLTADSRLVHSDINAMIVGTNPDGSFTPDTYPLESVGKRNPTVPNRLDAYREFTVIFHDENAVAQAFPRWYLDPVLKHTLHGVRDSFMINYGSGGIGTEIIANRLGVGPMHDCLTCAYEEFFLTGFTVGDVGQLVDVPANFGLEQCDPALNNCEAVGPKATKAFYPDDPANVHHSYTGDFVKFRNLHAGKEQHVFHLHNHQWLFNANDDDSNYLDAQGIGPGSGYTYEINFGGSGNRNKTAGDAIFHCHFYPHFAQGMWEMWRIHDTTEVGTELAVSNGGFHSTPFAQADGTPATGARAMPDGEIIAGTPIPAVVPLPGNAMAPMPGRVTVVARDANGDGIPESSQALVDRTDTDPVLVDAELNPTGLKNPGFPFWIAGIEHSVGQRPTTPPLDMLASAGGFDGGLPRHTLDGYAAGGTSLDTQTRLDFSKEVTMAKPIYFPEEGTDVERAAMAAHAKRRHSTVAMFLDGTTQPADFILNGQRPVAGAPYNEPCLDDEGDLFVAGQQGDFFDANGGLGTKGIPQFGAMNPRVYKGANVQFDAVFNKVGYHFPQQRIITLWEDVLPTINKERPPEPFVIRLNTFDCATYLHTNLVPKDYELDDYQVRTPTDIIGQHIHLPKWDLVSADGSANGWNYEDGTLSPGMVVERIHAINAWVDANAPGTPHLEPQPHPFFGAGHEGEWLGARTTIQRWFADPVVNAHGVDRGLGIIFTHDHFGPSTHQQIGLYATVLTEPAGSQWVHNETGEQLGTRADGGPTTWQAAILRGEAQGHTVDQSFDPYREFYFEYSDFQSAYQAGVYIGAGPDGRPNHVAPDATSFLSAINPSFRQQANPVFPDMAVYPPVCPGGVPRPCPEAISADDPGMLVVNYRNEPVGLRVFDPNKPGPDGKSGAQADGVAGDLAFALSTKLTDKAGIVTPITRAIPELNVMPDQNTNINGTQFPPHINTGAVEPSDPFTPMLRVYQGDTVRVKVQSGGHEHEHNTSIHGVKWLQAGSGFGNAKNSGWRNAQNAGISEQLTFHVPIDRSVQGIKGPADHAYSMDNSQDGWWSGMWGIMRAYDEIVADLPVLPTNINPKPSRLVNAADFNGACPIDAPVTRYDVVAVLANDVLGNGLGATIVPNDPTLATQHNGGALNPDGGTLVYNPRETAITLRNGTTVTGPLHDPTAMMYVRIGDLEPVPGQKGGACKDSNQGEPGVLNPACQVRLKADVPVEPLTLRADAGACLEVTLHNRLPEIAPDLPGFNTLLGVVPRDQDPLNGMTTFNNNLIRPSSHVGLHAQVVDYDVTQHDGVNVGINIVQTVAPTTIVNGKLKKDKAVTYRWYAGDVDQVPEGNGVRLVATPVEFGGSNLSPADRVKQGQKALVGALVIEPQGSTWAEDAQQRTAATVTRADGSSFRDLVIVNQKGLNHRFKDGTAVPNIAAEGLVIPEDSHDSAQMGVNYGSEPLWFRFGVTPNAPFGNVPGGLGAVPNAHEAYSNALAGGDPATPVFTAQAGQEVLMRVVEPSGVGRGTIFNLHGHVWARDPYVCPGSADLGLVGKCTPNEVGSRAIGDNPLSFYLGGQESVTPMAHFDIRLPSAGGSTKVAGDYLFRDQAAFGNLNGMWGILRVGAGE